MVSNIGDYYCKDCGVFTYEQAIKDKGFILCPKCGKDICEIEKTEM